MRISVGGNNQDKIDDLIAATSDPVARGILMVLSKIDHALDKNTEATQHIADSFNLHHNEFALHRLEFQQHKLDEEKLITGIKWAWWAATGMAGCILLLGGYIIAMQFRTIEIDSAQIRTNSMRLTTLENDIAELKRRQLIDDDMHRNSK